MLASNAPAPHRVQLTLVSHRLCPYVQRAVIALNEKDVQFERVYVDLTDKPDWFRAISPLGKVPLLIVPRWDGGKTVVFESAVILEYIEETLPSPLHPADPLERARHRGWVEYGSSILSRVARFYSAPDEAALAAAAGELASMVAMVEAELGEGPWFGGREFSLVDAVFGPVFRYFDTFDRIGDFGMLDGKPKLAAWREELAARPSVRTAVAEDYPERLADFLARKSGALAERMRVAA